MIVPFNEHVGIAPAGSEPGTGRAQLPDAVQLRNHFGAVHGGALFTVGEVAAARAILALVGGRIESLRAITRGAQIRYLKPARGAVMAAATVRTELATIIESLAAGGKCLPVIDVSLTDDSGVVVAEMTVEWHLSKLPPRPAQD